MASISLWASLQGPAWASSQHGSHRLVQNFPHGSQGLGRQKQKVPVSYSGLSPDTGTPSLQPYPWVKAVPGDTKAPPLHGSAVKESVAASNPPQRATEKEQAWEDGDWIIEEMQRKVPRGQEVQTEAPEGDLLDGPAHREGRNGRCVAALATPLFCSCLVAQPYPAICDPIDCSSPDSFVSGRLQARILGWVAISFSRGSSCPRDGACISCKSPALQAGSSPLSHQGALDQTERTIALLSRSAQARE